MQNNLPEPNTRKETFLASAAGMEVETPTPITREEMYLDAIGKGGGSGDAYTKAETDALLADKADKTNTLTSWKGTAAQYAQLQTDDYDLYFIEEAVSP